MNACPQCGVKNKENNKYCKKCGQDLSALSPAYREKKEKVTGNKSYVWLWALVIAALVAGGGFFYKGYSQKAGNSGMSPSGSSSGISSPVGVAEAGPAAKRVDMTDIKATLKDGYLQFSSAQVKSSGMIYTEYQKGNKNVPLTAFFTPKGKLVTAVSMCEPCRSKRFHIEGKNLVCNSCNTIWTLEELKGISGGCLKYPPDVIAHTLDGDTIKIKEADILVWKPRV